MADSPLGYAELFEALPIPATLVDAGGIILAINQAFIDYARHRGRQVRREDRVGQSIVAFAGQGPERESLESLVAEVLGKGVERSYRWESSRQRHGMRVYVDIRGRPIRDVAGRVIGALILREDVTEKTLQDRQWLVTSRVREEVWKMRDSRDIVQVLAVVRGSLEELEVPFDFCGVNLVDKKADPPAVLVYSMTREGQGRPLDADRLGTDVIARIWRDQRPVYRRDLDREDLFGESALLDRDYGRHIRSVLDVPFSHGTLAVDSAQPEAFTQEDIAMLEGVARVLSEGFQRMEDLQALEQQYRRLDELYQNDQAHLAALETANQKLQREMETRRRVEEDLRQAQKMEAVGQLTAGVAHNFNNLLQALMGNVELALREAPAEIREPLRTAVAATERGADIVRQLMVFSHPHQARELAPLDLRRVVSDCAEICYRTFDKGIELSVEMPDKVPAVVGHLNYLEQALLNLLLNARDALQDSGASARRIRLAVDVAPLTSLQRQSHPEAPASEYVRLRVIDNGKGMDEETRQRVFVPFFTTKEVGKGTGLGLATAYAIVREHRGWVECASAPGQGATFSVYLPVAAGDSPEVKKDGRRPLPGGSETILLVDDEEMVRSVASRLLERVGYTVLTAQDGVEGLAVFRQRRSEIRAILLDLGMPRLSGSQMLIELRRIDPQVKVVLFTGYAVEREDCAGAQAVLYKPIEWPEMLRVLRQVLDA